MGARGELHPIVVCSTKSILHGCWCPLLPFFSCFPTAPSLQKTPQWRGLSSVHLLRVMFFLPPPPPAPSLLSVTFTPLCLVFPGACPRWQCCLLLWMQLGWQVEGETQKAQRYSTWLHSRQDRQEGYVQWRRRRRCVWRQRGGRAGKLKRITDGDGSKIVGGEKSQAKVKESKQKRKQAGGVR